MLDIEGLCCVRDERTLFDQLCFSIRPGELVQVEGPNGAGKTTLLRIVAGLAMADAGNVLWKGVSISRNRDDYHQDLLYIGHLAGVKSMLTPFENLAFYEKMAERPVDNIYQALTKVGLVGYEDVPVGQLSAGQQRRVALARLWLSQAPLWILDEPLTAIDKQGIAQLIALFDHRVQNGGIILFTTHQDVLSSKKSIRKIKLSGGEWR